MDPKQVLLKTLQRVREDEQRTSKIQRIAYDVEVRWGDSIDPVVHEIGQLAPYQSLKLRDLPIYLVASHGSYDVNAYITVEDHKIIAKINEQQTLFRVPENTYIIDKALLDTSVICTEGGDASFIRQITEDIKGFRDEILAHRITDLFGDGDLNDLSGVGERVFGIPGTACLDKTLEFFQRDQGQFNVGIAKIWPLRETRQTHSLYYHDSKNVMHAVPKYSMGYNPHDFTLKGTQKVSKLIENYGAGIYILDSCSPLDIHVYAVDDSVNSITQSVDTTKRKVEEQVRNAIDSKVRESTLAWLQWTTHHDMQEEPETFFESQTLANESPPDLTPPHDYDMRRRMPRQPVRP